APHRGRLYNDVGAPPARRGAGRLFGRADFGIGVVTTTRGIDVARAERARSGRSVPPRVRGIASGKPRRGGAPLQERVARTPTPSRRAQSARHSADTGGPR